MPKASRTPSHPAAPAAPEASPTPAEAEPKRRAKAERKSPAGGRVVGAIVPQIGSLPAEATHFSIWRIAASGKALEKISIDVDGVGLDEFPVEVLRQHGIDVVRSHGAGLYQLGWLGVDAAGKRKGLGKSRRITIGEVATKAARTPARSAAELEADAYRRGREDAARDLSETYQWRDRMRDDAYKGLLEIATAKAGGAVAAAPSAELSEMRTELAVIKARQAWEQEREREEDDDDDDEDDEADADAHAMALAAAQNPDGIAAQIATIAAVAKQVAPLLAFVGPLLAARQAAPAPAPVVTVAAAPAPQAATAKPKRAPRATKADTRPAPAAKE